MQMIRKLHLEIENRLIESFKITTAQNLTCAVFDSSSSCGDYFIICVFSHASLRNDVEMGLIVRTRVETGTSRYFLKRCFQRCVSLRWKLVKRNFIKKENLLKFLRVLSSLINFPPLTINKVPLNVHITICFMP